MINARRGNVFGGIYDNYWNCIKCDSLVSISELLEDKNNDYELVSYDDINNAIVPNPDVIKIIKKHFNDDSVNPHQLKPNYLKLTEAEENRLKDD